MEEEISRMKNFLKDFFNNEQSQSPTSEEATRIGNYPLDPEDVSGHVIDWVINYLDNRKCPYSLAVSIAKEIALQMSVYLTQNEVENSKKINPADLYSEAISKIPTACNAFSNQVNLDPISSTKYATSAFAIRNKRRKMEDRHVILHDLNAVLDLKDAPYQSYYAVFDGHSGIDAACYASAQLHVNIGKHPDFLTNTSKAITEGYRMTDMNFINKCNKLNIKSGCTALSALIRNNTIFLSWLGDSQAVLVKGGVPIKITSPHKPDREDERQRIEELGGHIAYIGTWRVNGLLAVTRAIGDPDQKPFISCEPEIDIINLDGNEDFLILACDGLWDGISPEDASSALYRYLSESSPDNLISPVAAKLVHQSKIQGSEDNITAIVVFLRDVKDIIDNVDKCVSNSSYYVQNHDFVSMNGNMKILSVDSNSDAPFPKPTVLELNAASSKKLKNSANVMSSAGFGSTSYNYQFVENQEESSFHSLESSVVDSSQTAHMSQAAYSASCFAPEATALSELPTPPIDDMLASQQFDNFCSTDLYKELNNSVQASEQLIEGSDKTNEFKSDELLTSNVQASPQIISNTVANIENKSLCNTDKKSDTVSRTDALSPDEAIGIASDVVLNTIETAVKCLSEESLESAAIQSSKKLNPYAKPFVMKSFFNSEESGSMSDSFIGSSLSDVLPPGQVTNFKVESQSIAEIAKEFDNSQIVSKDLEKNQLLDVLGQSNINPIDLEQSVYSENVSDKLPLNVSSNEIENKFTGNLNIEATSRNASTDHSFQNKDLLVQLECTNISETSDVSLPEHVDLNLPVETQFSDMSQLRSDSVSLKSESNIIEKDIAAPIVNILPFTGENEKLNMSPLSSENPAFLSQPLHVEPVVESITQSRSNLTPEQKGNDEFLQSANKDSISMTNVQVDKSHMERTEQVFISESISPLPKENTVPILNEISDLLDISDGLSSGVSGADIKLKCDEIQKSIADTAVKSENSEPSSFVEPISAIGNIKDKLLSAESEVPSDPSVEDSRVEPIAVDLKSLPEGIPEAEGVTEDIDSDSEKDGGWSYMKGNTVTGTKSKLEDKASKTTKSNEIKSNIITKSKRDLSKPSLDVKSKARNNTIDKTKGTMSDKCKTISQDKNKIAADKQKTLVDKNRILCSSDKSKRIEVERKTDVKSKILKSSATSSVTKLTPIKTNKIAAVSSSIKKETSVSTSTTTAAKPTRPTTLLRTSASATKTISTTTVTDKSASSNRTIAKSKVTSHPPENKPIKQNIASSTISKGSASIQSKSSTLLSRTSTTRPASTVPTKTSTIVRTTVQKSTVSELKPKLHASSATAARKPISAASKKSDVKEVKDSVNKQILAKKTATASRVESNSTLTSKRIASSNNRSTSLKAPAAAKTESNKRGVPKVAPSKPGVKTTDLKVSQGIGKSKEKLIGSTQDKTDETKNISNAESDQKNVTEAAEGVEEKFILETNDKEIPKEVQNVTNEEQTVENSSLTKTTLPDEVISVAECNPESM